MIFDIITIFPNSFSALYESIVKRAQDDAHISLNIWDLRNWTDDPYRTVDDKPFGGGAGMVMKLRPIYKALKDLKVYPERDKKTRVVLTSAKGSIWTQTRAEEFASTKYERLVVICGHYEGVDNRVIEHKLIDEEIRVGDYILSGGEIPAMLMIDSVTRLIPGVLGNADSIEDETTFGKTQLLAEYPQYTRPAQFVTDEGEEWSIPEILLSGDHSKIDDWKKENKEKRKI